MKAGIGWVVYEVAGWTKVPTSPASYGPCKMQRYRFRKFEDGSSELTTYPDFKRE
jgi:hypothetical protein